MDEGMRANEGKDRFFNPCQVDTQRDLGDEQPDFQHVLKTCPFPCPNNDCRDCK